MKLYTLKLWERVIQRRLQLETHKTENDFGFVPRRSTMEAMCVADTDGEVSDEPKGPTHGFC